MAQSGDLGEDEPDPMARLAPASQLTENVAVDGFLFGDETLELVGHARTSRSGVREQQVKFQGPAVVHRHESEGVRAREAVVGEDDR
jgi:hypothetical protein